MTTTSAGTQYLKPSSGGEAVIPACDGGQTIANNGKDVFTGWIDPDFKNYGANERGQATPATTIQVYEMVEDADFATMFDSLDKDTDKLCLTQHQILEFVRSRPDLLRTEGYATFFAFKSKGKLFVAVVTRFDDGSLSVLVRRFDYDVRVWHARGRRRVVVPQLAA
jgi:hypothetical protein